MEWLNVHRRIVSPKTTARRISSLRAFGKWVGLGMVLEDYSAPAPARPMPHPIPEGIAGVRRMIECARNPEQAALVSFCGLMGLRVAEALSITPADINFGEMMLTVRGKGDKTRIVPISTEAWTYLQRPVLDTAVVNMAASVIGYQDRFARKVITDMGVRAGLQRSISSHDLRATFATAVYDSTKDQRAVQELLGHASGQTTELYIGVRVDTMRKAVEL